MSCEHYFHEAGLADGQGQVADVPHVERRADGRDEPLVVARLSGLAAAMVVLHRQRGVRYAEAQLRLALKRVQALHANAQARVAQMPCLLLRFSPQKLPATKYKDLDEQLAGQQAGLNALTVQEYLQARARFSPHGRNPAVARHARSAHRQRMQQHSEAALLQQGLDATQAHQQAVQDVDRAMRSLHALHNPDLVAGGRDEITGFGDGQVNSTIGRQWNQHRRGCLSRVEQLDHAAEQIAAEDRCSCHMNGRLERGD